MRMVHAVAKGRNRPCEIIGLFVESLLAKVRRRIHSVDIQRGVARARAARQGPGISRTAAGSR